MIYRILGLLLNELLRSDDCSVRTHFWAEEVLGTAVEEVRIWGNVLIVGPALRLNTREETRKHDSDKDAKQRHAEGRRGASG